MSHSTWRSTGGVTIHRYIPFKPHSVNPVGDAMRHGDPGDLARERVKTYTETDSGGGDEWRSLLLRKSQDDEENE
jgi:hypothetical protein